MAGASGNGMAGLVYRADLGGYVNAKSIDPKTGQPYGSGGGGAVSSGMAGGSIASGRSTVGSIQPRGTTTTTNPDGSTTTTESGWYTDASGQLKYQPSKSVTAAGTGGGYGGASGGGSRAGGGSYASSSATGGNSAEIERLIAEIRSTSNPTADAPQIPGPSPSPSYDPAADRATYGAAKERTGLATQAALRALRESLNQRGLVDQGGRNSGIEAELTQGLIRGGLGELANTDRQLAETGAQRQYDAGQRDIDRTIDVNKFNASSILSAQGRPSTYNLSKWSLLAQLASQLY